LNEQLFFEQVMVIFLTGSGMKSQKNEGCLETQFPGIGDDKKKRIW